MSDIPFLEAVEAAEEAASMGFYVHQKFTCAHCGQRLTMEEPFKFFERGTCDKCHKETNIKEVGCGFLLTTFEVASATTEPAEPGK